MTITCRNFEQSWNEQIDAEADAEAGRISPGAGCPANHAAQDELGLAGRRRALMEHAAECAACRQIGVRYQALDRALRTQGPAPAPPAGFVDRILAELQTQASSAWPVYGGFRRERVWPIAAALAAISASAALIAIAHGIFNRTIDRTRLNGPRVVLHNTPVDPSFNKGRNSEAASVDTRALYLAVAEASAATWDLARSASEPAARISRQVVDAATDPERDRPQPISANSSDSDALVIAVPSLDALAPDTAAAGAMLQQVGDRLATGVRPLSESARHAFGFLLGPPVARPEVPTNLPAQKGT
jgi:hypothetical protein